MRLRVYILWSCITHTISDLQNLSFVYTRIAKWLKMHWNIECLKCLHINLPGFTGIGHNQHLPAWNKNYNQEKGDKPKKRGEIKKKFSYYFLFKIFISYLNYHFLFKIMLLTCSVESFVLAPSQEFFLMIVYVL